MRRDWEPEELVDRWTLVEDDWRPVGNKAAMTRLGFSALLTFVEPEDGPPRHADEVPRTAIWSHANPSGTVQLDVTRHDFGVPAATPRP